MKKGIILLLALVAGLSTACGGPPKVWVLGDSAGPSLVSFDKAPRVAYRKGAAIKGTTKNYGVGKSSVSIFMMDKEDKYKLKFQNLAGSGEVEFEADDAFGELTVLDPAGKKYIAVLDVGSLYSKSGGAKSFPLMMLRKPAKVHTLEVNAHHAFWWTRKMPSSLTGVSVAGSDSHVSAYKIFALLPKVVEGVSKEQLAVKLSEAVLAVERR